jgi:hypothetical protein
MFEAEHHVDPSFQRREFAVEYQIEITNDAFGQFGFGSLFVPFAHNSPSKVGQNTVMVIPEPSTYMAGLAAIALLAFSHDRFAAQRKAAQPPKPRVVHVACS